MSPVHLVVYGRPECHLCQDMLTTLEDLQQAYPFTLNMVDVDEDPALQAQYGGWVPVLIADGHEICHYHLDLPALKAFFDSALPTKSE